MLTPTERKRQGYIHELIVTEENYVNDLQLVTEVTAAVGAQGWWGALAEDGERREASAEEDRALILSLRTFQMCGEHSDGKPYRRFLPKKRWLNSHPRPTLESYAQRGRDHSCQGT